jgi:hypothetical protein
MRLMVVNESNVSALVSKRLHSSLVRLDLPTGLSIGENHSLRQSGKMFHESAPIPCHDCQSSVTSHVSCRPKLINSDLAPAGHFENALVVCCALQPSGNLCFPSFDGVFPGTRRMPLSRTMSMSLRIPPRTVRGRREPILSGRLL